MSNAGREDEDFLFSVENSSFKLRDIFLPSTMLVTKELAASSRPREVSYVSLGKSTLTQKLHTTSNFNPTISNTTQYMWN